MQPPPQTIHNNATIDRPLLIRLGVVGGLVFCLMLCWAIIPQISLPNPLVAAQPAVRQIIGEQETGFMAIKNREILASSFGDITTTISDQMFSEHYSMTGHLDRHAEIVGAINKLSNSYTFSVRFIPSNDLVRTVVTMKNVTTRDYSLTMKQENNNGR